jgi:phage baseplate assembly protein gpV
MTAIMPVLRAIVRDELIGASGAGVGGIELGVVTDVASNDGGSGDRNCEVNVRLRGSDLELQRVPVVSPRVGVSSVPRVGDLVVVGFVGNDLNGAVVLGCLHTDAVHPPDAKPDEIVYEVPDDAADGVRRVELRLPSDNTITIEDNKVVIDLGGSVVTIDGGNVTIKASDGITFESEADVSIKADGNIKFEASGNVDLKASGNLTAQGSGAAKLAGGSVTIAGSTSFSPG